MATMPRSFEEDVPKSPPIPVSFSPSVSTNFSHKAPNLFYHHPPALLPPRKAPHKCFASIKIHYSVSQSQESLSSLTFIKQRVPGPSLPPSPWMWGEMFAEDTVHPSIQLDVSYFFSILLTLKILYIQLCKSEGWQIRDISPGPPSSGARSDINSQSHCLFPS